MKKGMLVRVQPAAPSKADVSLLMKLMIKQNVNIIRSFKRLLKVLEPYVKDFRLMIKEKKFPGCHLRPMEVWGNWLICAVLRKYISGEITFADDPEGDGIILDKRDGSFRYTEHVSAVDNPFSKQNLDTGEKRIIERIKIKIALGDNYADGKILIAFFDGVGLWYRNKVREAISGKHKFYKVYLIGLLSKDEHGFAYSVTELHENNSTTFKVQINPNFDSWSVSKM